MSSGDWREETRVQRTHYKGCGTHFRGDNKTVSERENGRIKRHVVNGNKLCRETNK